MSREVHVPFYERLGVQFPRPTHRFCLSFRDVEDLLAERGIVAQFNLGLTHLDGLGVVQDRMVAYMWLSLAVAQTSGADRDTYVRVRDLAAEEMFPGQIAKAQRLVREWKPTGQP